MKILVVDDDTVSRLVLEGVLGTIRSAEIVQACDGLEAWDLLEGGLRPHVCCSDIRMPGLGGLELMDRARAHPVLAALPFVLISSAADRATVEAAVRRGAAGYILKPFNGMDTRTTVMRVMRQARARHAESPQATQRRLHLTKEDLAHFLSALAADVQALQVSNGPAQEDAARIRTACLTLGLWRAAELLQLPGEAAPIAPVVLDEVIRLVQEQAATLGVAAPARAVEEATSPGATQAAEPPVQAAAE